MSEWAVAPARAASLCVVAESHLAAALPAGAWSSSWLCVSAASSTCFNPELLLPDARSMRGRLPAWLRPGGQQEAYRFHRLTAEEGAHHEAGPSDEAEGDSAGVARDGATAALRPPGRWCPEETAGFLSRLSFNYVGGLIQLGYRCAWWCIAAARPCNRLLWSAAHLAACVHKLYKRLGRLAVCQRTACASALL